jgi:hypothetical protein
MDGKKLTFVLRADPPTCGINRSTPKGRDGSRRSVCVVQ